MSKIVLDVRSGEENSRDTLLSLRHIEGSVMESGLREGRMSYEIGGNLGDLLLIASGDGEIGVESRVVSFVYLFSEGGKYYYGTGLRDGHVLIVRDDLGLSLRLLYGGTVVESDRDDLGGLEGLAEVGLGFWCTRNDIERERFRDGVLLPGCSGSLLGVLGVGDLGLVSSLDGYLRIGSEKFRIGGSEVVLAVEGEDIGLGVLGVVYNPSGRVEILDNAYLGESVYHIRGSGGLEGEVRSGDYLSPCPFPFEHPLLRDGSRGYLEVRRVLDFSVEIEVGVVELNLEGEVRFSGDILFYDGLVLNREPLSLGGGFDLGVEMGLVDIPVYSIPDGSGLEPVGEATSFIRNGSGLVWSYGLGKYWLKVGSDLLEVLILDELPLYLERGYAYLLRGSRKIVLNESWSLSGGHKLYEGSLRIILENSSSHYSSLNWSVGGGSFRLTNGDVVSFTTSSVLGSDGVVFEDGFLRILEGYEVEYPSDDLEMESLKGVGLLPRGGFTGLVLDLGGSVVRGYYDYADESVGSISGLMDYQRLTFRPRLDFLGYSAGVHFRVGEKYLLEGVDYEYASNPEGFRWVERKSSSGILREETSRLFLDVGIRPDTSSLTLRREVLGGGIEESVYVEGVDYDILGGEARFQSVIGMELTRGFSVEDFDGTRVTLHGGDLTLLRAGDWILVSGIFTKVESVLGSEFLLSGEVLFGESWVGYRGYREGVEGLETPDASRLVGEVFEVLGAGGDVTVYKVQSSLDMALGVDSFVRKGEDEYPLFILEEERLESPYSFDVNDVHIVSGSYILRTGGIDYHVGVSVGGHRFVELEGKFVFQSEEDGVWVSDSSWLSSDVILVRLPRENLTDVAEVSLSGDGLSTPFDGDPDFFVTSFSEVSFNHTLGSISFADPLPSGVGVEVSYLNSSAERVLETLIFFVTGEVLERESGKSFRFNSVGRLVESDIQPSVFINSELIYAHRYSFTQDKVIFDFEVDEGAEVKISYAVLNSLGGEQSVRLSGSILNVNFGISVGSREIETPRDLSESLEVGDLIQLGTHLFTVSSVSASSLGVFPPARYAVNSSSLKVLRVPSLSYEGSSYQNAFLNLVGCSLASTPKSPYILIDGDFLGYFPSLSILLIEGVPYRVFQSTLTENGQTRVTVEGFTSGHNLVSTEGAELLVSYRPIYEGGETSISLTTGVLSDKSYKLLRYSHDLGYGTELVLGVDFRINFESGDLNLLTTEVSHGYSYFFFHTALASVKPLSLYGGRVSYPSYSASYLRSRPPSEYDNLELFSKCVVYSPDTFYIRIVEEDVYASEVAQSLIDRVTSQNGYGGKKTFTNTITRGNSLRFYDLLAEDVVSRTRISRYDGYVRPVEEIISTSTGYVVGDKDGRFKFDLLQSGVWGGAGLEDSLTREIEPRYIFAELLDPLNPADDFSDPSDPITVGGTSPNLDVLEDLRSQQRALISNEMDDYVLVGWKGKMEFNAITNSFNYVYLPEYKQGWERSQLSRLFPTHTKMRSIRSPGDLYAERDGRSTNGITIANVENSSLGNITNVTSLTLKKRPARFRIVEFSASGFPEINILSQGKPTFLVSAVPLDQFPLNILGLPDTSQFFSQGGSIADAAVGSIDRVHGGLSIGSRVSLSIGDRFYPLLDRRNRADLEGFEIPSQLKLAKVEEVLSGCLVVLEGSSYTVEVNGTLLSDLRVEQGDTLVENFKVDLDETTPSSIYRVGSDVGLNYSTGEIIDISLPSLNDPAFPYQEILDQNVPSEFERLEGEVGFSYNSTEPFIYPALLGLSVDDSGDEQIPYLKRYSERVLLAKTPMLSEALVVQEQNTRSGLEEYLYPDEVRDSSLIVENGYLTTGVDLSSLNGICEQTPRQGDLIFIRPHTGIAGDATTGVSELAEVSGSHVLYPPHFSSPTHENSYSITDLVVQMDGNTTKGITVKEDLIYNVNSNEWDSSVTTLTFEGYTFIDELLNKISLEGGSLTIHLHDYNDTSDVFKIVFEYDGISWTISTVSFTGVVVVASNSSLTSWSNNTIEVTQDPIPNPLTLAEEVNWPSNTHETWLYNHVAVSHLWGAFVGYRFFTSQGSSRVTEMSLTAGYPVLYLDYRVDVTFASNSANKISSNRLDLVSTNANFTSWFSSNSDPLILLEAGGGVEALSIVPTLEILSTGMEVKEDATGISHTIASDINTNSLMGYSPYSVGDEASIIDSTTIRVNSLYGITREDDQMSLLVGSEVTSGGNICEGVARYGNYVSNFDLWPGQLRQLTVSHGSLENIEAGDLVYINRGHGTGTHRVKNVITQSTNDSITVKLGSSYVTSVTFPKVISIVDNGNGTATILTDSEDLSLYFNEVGYREIVVVLNDNYLNAPVSNAVGVFDQNFSRSLVQITYDTIAGGSFTFTAPATYFDGANPTQIVLGDLISLLGEGGQTIGGIHKMPFDALATGLFSSAHPVRVDPSFDYTLKMAGVIEGNSLNLISEYDEDGLTISLNFLVLFLQNWVSEIQDIQGNVYGRGYLLPNDELTISISSEAGIVLDKSFPKLLRNYRDVTPVLLGDGSSQVTSLLDYSINNAPGVYFYEEVDFVVRRVRRFTDVFSKLINNLEGIRYLYEERVGLVENIQRVGDLILLNPLEVDGQELNVGDILNTVSIGDDVYCYDGEDVQTLHIRVSEVTSSHIKGRVVSGNISASHISFKVNVRSSIVPEIQSFNSLIAHGFDVIYSTEAQEGISVGEENILTDTNINFLGLLSESDLDSYYLVIDPQGLLEGTSSEFGKPAKGDDAQGNFGTPSTLDDNRGSYKILSFTETTLNVEFFSGGLNPEQYYLPLVSGSSSNSLRVTSGIDGGTYTSSPDSIHPFSYRILKRKSYMSESLAGAVLFYRERTLSWVEKVRVFNNLPSETQTWSSYEEDGLINFVGEDDPTHPDNSILINTLLGDDSTYPFTDDMLSIPDRRLLIEDPQMEAEGHSLVSGMPSMLEMGISSMSAREKRNDWISIRTHQTEGTLVKLSQIDLSTPNLKALEDINE